jgi:GTPase SAR1 family protein
VNPSVHSLQLWNTAGQEELVNVRRLSHPNIGVLLMCLSAANRVAHDNTRNKRVGEIKQ